MALHAVAQAPPRLLRPCPKALSPNLAIDPPVLRATEVIATVSSIYVRGPEPAAHARAVIWSRPRRASSQALIRGLQAQECARTSTETASDSLGRPAMIIPIWFPVGPKAFGKLVGTAGLNRRPLGPQSHSGCRWVSPSNAGWALEQPKQWLGVADCRLKLVHVGSRNGSPRSDAGPGQPGERSAERVHLLPPVAWPSA